MKNPFVIEPYVSSHFFCDREEETARIIECLENRRNITLISPRRLGKTGLIYRVFDQIKENKLAYETIYADMSSTQTLEDFVKILSESVASVLHRRNKIKDILKAVGGIRPLISYDELTGQPQLSFTYRTEEDKKVTLRSLFSYMENSGKEVVVAIDEFQQIREYPGIQMEALLRTCIQPLHHVRFIFCGSKKHIMTDMFTNAKKPFYESTTNVPVGKLNEQTYERFISGLFEEYGKHIDSELVKDIIRWTKDHTYYTQSLCNEVFSCSGKEVRSENVKQAKRTILQMNTDRFLEIKRMTTPSQWKLLKAVAKEGEVYKPTSTGFLSKYGLTSGPAVLKSLKSLVEKELILETVTLEGNHYSVYNVFFSRYLEKI